MPEARRYRCHVGLGANLGDPVATLRAVLEDLAALPLTRLVAASDLYRNPPVGPAGQPDYVNGVAVLDTALSALALLDRLQDLETARGRVRTGPRWGPRTLDLDLLLYQDLRCRHPRLSLPHPRMAERPFVLVPLAELAPGLHIPGRGRVGDLAGSRLPPGYRRLGPGAAVRPAPVA